MKLIIDIPEDSYERVMNPDKFYRDIDGGKIRWSVYKGTPIPDNATVCDIEQIRAEMLALPTETWNMVRRTRVLEIIDKYTKGEKMNGIGYLCKHYDADEDCARCFKRGIMVGGCPANCPDFADVRNDMSDEMLAERERLMALMGVKDTIPYKRG